MTVRSQAMTCLLLSSTLSSLAAEAAQASAHDLKNQDKTVQIDLTFENENNNLDRINQIIESDIRFRSRESTAVPFIRVGINTFQQNNIETINNATIQTGIQDQLGDFELLAGGGIDVFDRLTAKPNAFAQAKWKATPDLTLTANVDYGPYKFSADSLEKDIRAVRITPAAYWQIDETTSLSSSYTWGVYSDGNQEQEVSTSIQRRFKGFFLGASLFFSKYSQDLNNGYFDPDGYWYYDGEAGWEGRIADGLNCRFSASLGQQRFDKNTSNVNGYQGRCTAQLASNVEAALGYQYGTVIKDPVQNGSETATISGQVRFTF